MDRTLSAVELAHELMSLHGFLPQHKWEILRAASDHLRRSATPAEVREVAKQLVGIRSALKDGVPVGSLAPEVFDCMEKAATLLESLPLPPPAEGLAADRIEFLRTALENIRLATIKGKVCDDVAWFSEIETLHDFCAGTLERDANVAAGQQSLPLPTAAQEARNAALEEAAKVARDGCLVPPDGGSPTEAERQMCDAIASHIRAIKGDPQR